MALPTIYTILRFTIGVNGLYVAAVDLVAATQEGDAVKAWLSARQVSATHLDFITNDATAYRTGDVLEDAHLLSVAAPMHAAAFDRWTRSQATVFTRIREAYTSEGEPRD